MPGGRTAVVRRAHQLNCKPNYPSVMNYLFQLGGLLDDDGVPHLDYSRDADTGIDESSLSDGSLGAQPYRTAWFAPLVPGTTRRPHWAPPRRNEFCGGMNFPDPLPAGWVPMARVETASASAPVDWNANGDPSNTAFAQDVNFDGRIDGALAFPPSAPLQGSNDWAGPSARSDSGQAKHGRLLARHRFRRRD